MQFMSSLQRGDVPDVENTVIYFYIAQGGGPVNLLNGTGLELSDADSESGVFISLQVYVAYTILFSNVLIVSRLLLWSWRQTQLMLLM